LQTLGSAYPTPLNCTETSRLCTSFLAFSPSPNQTLDVIMSMFDVLPNDVTVEGNGRNYVFVRKNCSCATSPVYKYLTNTTYTVRKNGGSVYDLVVDSYGGLAYLSNFSRPARTGAVVSLQLFCGCSTGLWNYLMSYVMKEGDSIELLASRFGVSMDSIEIVNKIDNPDNVTIGALYYIPLNSVPGEPYPIENDSPPAPAPSPTLSAIVTGINHKSDLKRWWIIGSLGVGLALIIAVVLLFVCMRSSICFSDAQRNRLKGPEDEQVSHKFHILRTSSFWCGSGRLCCKSDDWRQTIEESSDRHTNIPKVVGTDMFNVEKPVVFLFEEILSCTEGFSESNLLGHGTYGSVYYGLLREQEVAVKRMTATKTKEFTAEMKVLCKVHHTNLVELIGYAASDDELFLIYEYAQKGSLGSHLHDPQNKGVYFKQISDFGLAKLVGRTNDGEASATRVVGTFGYLAPEYLRDGLATTRSDVYAFGVVLFELISGKEAITRTETVMLAALKHSSDSMSMSGLKDHIDPNLLDLFPHDCVFKMAMVAKQCVEDDPILRPDMKHVVISLSQILLSSVEWEATLAGNSQVFSGLVQGR
ncbi:Concanavalin A-like lectin/glucanase, subgroup, partial [Cynara cardunculus var. scolymus]